MPNPKFYKSKTPSVIYPLVVTNNKTVDRLINNKIMAEVVGEDVVKLRQELTERISDGYLTDMGYQVTYKKNGILSLTINSEGCGAYCSTGYNYLNFDIKTGKSLPIEDLICEDMLDSLKKIVFADKVKALNKYKEEERNSSDGNIDSVTINWAIEHVDENCIGTIQLDNFTLSDLGIEIMDRCEFPHAIRSQEPIYELKYPYNFIAMFLKPKYRFLISK